MAPNRGANPDFVSLVSLHVALDGIVEIEELFSQLSEALRAHPRAKRLDSLAAEMRQLLCELLRRDHGH